MRLLVPSQDKSRSYGMKEIALARFYIGELGLGETSTDAAILKKGKYFVTFVFRSDMKA